MSEPLFERVGRRTFLKVIGVAAPAAAAAACSAPPAKRVMPYVVPPEDDVPGVSTWYATTCGECPAGCGVTVRTREGRAIKIEGNPEHAVNQGAVCVRGQSSLQGLYDPDRIRGPQRREVTNAAAGQSRLIPAKWDDAIAAVTDRLRAARQDGKGGRVAIVTPLITGSLDTLVDTWAKAVGGARRLRYEPFAHEALRASSGVCFGRDAIPHYDFARAEVLVSFGADFLETWLSTVEYSAAFGQGRRVKDGRKSRFVHIEPRQSLTASNADEWLASEPGTELFVALAMTQVILAEKRAQGVSAAEATLLGKLVEPFAPDRVASRTGIGAKKIADLARLFSDPKAGAGRSLAVAGGVVASGSNATATQAAVHLLNYVAGNVGTTVQFGPDSSFGRASTYREMADLVKAMAAGEVDVLVTCGVNPAFALPGGLRFGEALKRVPFVVSLSNTLDETTARAHLVLPMHSPLEAWGDDEPRAGVRGLRQPVMSAQFDSRHAGDMLLDVAHALGGDAASALPAADFYEHLTTEWKAIHAKASGGASFDDFWADTLKRGGLWTDVAPQRAALAAGVSALSFGAAEFSGPADGLVVFPYPSLHFYDGRGANRSWLQEIPDPVTKAAWSSWAEVHPDTAHVLGAQDGQLVTIESPHGKLDVTVLVNAHMRPGTIALPIGQGHTEYGRYAAGVGVNPIALVDPAPEALSGGPRWLSVKARVTPREVRRPVPRLQVVDQQHGRGVAEVVSLADLVAGHVEAPEHHHSLYADHPHPSHHWGMVIDLDQCTGCNACVAACYAENNVPVLGVDAARRNRTMAWMRIQRFVEPAATGAETRHVPMLCQQCDHAPCESVCPVYATHHTDEGLNAQVYNRCVGTRYCANNCPYKVREFNWFEPEYPDPLNLQLNPDVTVRSVGVMEKCTFCVQRIQAGKGRAKDENREVKDGDVVPACAQTCPGQAIVFGDLNDPRSRVSELTRAERGYRIFDELNTRPAVTYLKKVTQPPVA